MVDSLRRKPDFAWLSPYHHDILRGGVRRASEAEAKWDGNRQEMSQLFHRMKVEGAMSMSVCNAMYGGTAIDADADSLIVLAKHGLVAADPTSNYLMKIR